MPPDRVQCQFCISEIHPESRICSVCGTDQRAAVRHFKRWGAILSTLSVVLGILTIAISLWPQALRALFYEEGIDIYEYVAREAPGRSKLTFLNNGDGDLFVNEVVFEYVSDAGNRLDRTIIVNEWIRRNEVRSFYPRTVQPVSHSTSGPKRFDAMASELGSLAEIKRCFSLMIADYAWKQRPLGFNVPPGVVDVPVTALVRASSARSKELIDFSATGDYAGFIMLAERCRGAG
ncbi:MAG: hypothetical protein ACMVY4_06395 [Minwuia sp.]|uniref:hypothetical protein n=1 Tax=Minwuia sp. TaxID=2493630 RepID=UPI003A877D74